MDATVTIPEAEAAPAPKKRGVRSARPMKRGGLRRENRWKRRGTSVQRRRMLNIAMFGLIAMAVFVALELMSKQVNTGPEGPMAKIAFQAFPEADPKRIEIFEKNDLPSTVHLHLPAHMIEPSRGTDDPFARLGAEFGRAERTLSGLEMASRIEQLSAGMLPDEPVKCHTYEVGGISSADDEPRQTRGLYIYLHPGC